MTIIPEATSEQPLSHRDQRGVLSWPCESHSHLLPWGGQREFWKTKHLWERDQVTSKSWNWANFHCWIPLAHSSLRRRRVRFMSKIRVTVEIKKLQFITVESCAHLSMTFPKACWECVNSCKQREQKESVTSTEEVRFVYDKSLCFQSKNIFNCFL